MSELNIEEIRKDFPILSEKVNGKPLVYLDNAATTQKPLKVMEAVRNYEMTHNGNPHRGHIFFPWQPRRIMKTPGKM